MASLEKIASVLDLMAEYVEQNEREKEAAATSVRTARIDKIAAAHLQVHGEELSTEARAKLARTDAATLDVVEELMAKQANASGAPEALGGPAGPDNPTPTSVKEAADAADGRFLSWIVS